MSLLQSASDLITRPFAGISESVASQVSRIQAGKRLEVVSSILIPYLVKAAKESAPGVNTPSVKGTSMFRIRYHNYS